MRASRLHTRRAKTMPCRSEDGVGIAELMIAVLIMGVVGAIVVSGLTSGLRTSSAAQARVQSLTELETSLQRVARDVRGSCPVVAAAANDITVATYRQGSEIRTRYWIAGPDRELRTQTLSYDTTSAAWVPGPEHVLANGITNMQPTPIAAFQYLVRDPTDGSRLTTVSPVDLPLTLVHAIELTLRVELADRDQIVRSTLVDLRNGGSPCPPS